MSGIEILFGIIIFLFGIFYIWALSFFIFGAFDTLTERLKVLDKDKE